MPLKIFDVLTVSLYRTRSTGLVEFCTGFSSPVMDGRQSPRTFTPACAAFTKTWRDESCILGVYHTAASLWGAERGRKSSITPNPSPEFTSVLFCSCSFSHPGWIRRGGEWSTLMGRFSFTWQVQKCKKFFMQIWKKKLIGCCPLKSIKMKN